MTETLGATLAAIFDGPTAHWNDIDSEVHVLPVGPTTDLLDDVDDVVRQAGCSVQDSWHAADALYLMATDFETEKPFHAVIVDQALSGVDAELFAVLAREDE